MVVEAVAVREATALKLDGELTDEVWARAPKIDGFVQREPKEGAAPTYRTEARVAYDAQHLYVAILALDPEPAKIAGFLTRRDSYSPSDWVAVLIDSYHDKRTAYEFSVNPAGVKQDKYYFNDGDEDQGWDAVWDVVVATRADGWSAEFRIPLSQLRFPPSEKPIFGLALSRQIARLNETSTWPLIARSTNGIVSQFGELRGLELSKSPKRLELVPYTVGDVSTKPDKENPLVKGVDPGASVGLDMKYAITPGLTLTATVNPDFGQVEADPAVVNLSAFETFFPGAAPVLRRRLGCLSLRHGLQRWQLHGPLLHAPDRAAAAALGRRPRQRLRGLPVEHDHHRRDESHREDRRFLGRHPQRADGRGGSANRADG